MASSGRGPIPTPDPSGRTPHLRHALRHRARVLAHEKAEVVPHRETSSPARFGRALGGAMMVTTDERELLELEGELDISTALESATHSDPGLVALAERIAARRQLVSEREVGIPRRRWTRCILPGYRDYGSDWSPDGTRIVYDSESREGGQGIWVVNADGSEATKLIDDGSVPAWSPDGTRIAFARPDLGEMVWYGRGARGTPFYLYVMDADGTNIQRLTDGQFSDYSPAWSPDGTQIAFVRNDREGAGLFVMNADGSDVRQVAG